MELYVSEFSKYVITLLIALYTYESFAVFRFWQWLNAAVATLVTLFGSSRLVRPE